MKYIFYTPIAIIALLCACKSSPKSDAALADTITVTDSTATVTTVTKPEGNPIDFDNTKVIDTAFVTILNGTDMKQAPDEASVTLGKYEYGTRLDVIEITNEWLGVRDRVTRNYTSNNKSVSSTRWEKVYVKRKQTGKITDIKLSTKDLNTITLLTHNDKTETYPNGKQLNGYIDIELIDKALFDEKKATAVEHILRDTNAITKVKGVITLPCTQKNKIYKDNITDEDNSAEYTYYGQIEALNKYLVSGGYYEAWDCKLVDKTTGKETSVGDVPTVSPDLKHLICLYENPYNATTELELYQIKNTVPSHIVSLSFTKWMPELEKDNMFWDSDGYLYVPVLYSSVYYEVSDSPAKNYTTQFIRIKIKS